MRMIPPEHFRSVLSAYRVDAEPSYDDCRYYRMHGDHQSRFWETPRESRSTLRFIESLLAGMDPWQEAIVWPRHAHWTFSDRGKSASERIANATLRMAGIPDNAYGAILFTRSEIDSMVSVLFIHALFGISTHDDLYLVPDHAQQLLQLDHHDVIHVFCRTEKGTDSFVDHMKRKGFLLPTEVPDPTFKHPAWMAGEK